MTTLQLYEKLRETMTPEAAEAIANALDEFSHSLQQTVRREDFSELKWIVAELGAAQKRTEQRVEELAQAQKRTEETLVRGFADIGRRLDVLGSRWGDQAEEAFRQGLLETVRNLGFTVEHFRGQDPEGFINHRPRSYDLDVLVRNGQTVVAEIKSNASGADVTEFHRSVELYKRQTGRKVDKAILVAVTIQRRALENAKECGVVVATDFASLET